MEDHNFSRAFQHIDDEEIQSPIQELVFTAVEFILSRKNDFPKDSSVQEQLLFVHKSFRHDDLSLKVPKERKSSEKAQKFLQSAAEPLPTSSSSDLLQKYNYAVRFSEPKSEMLVNAFTARGVYLQATDKFEEAAIDFEEAISQCHEDTELFRLNHRLAQCYSKCKQHSNAAAALQSALNHLEKSVMEERTKAGYKKRMQESIAKLTGKPEIRSARRRLPQHNWLPHRPRADFPSVSSVIQIRETSHQGRFAVADEDIPCGTLLAVDDPIASILNPDDVRALFDHCCRCLIRGAAPLPCDTCSAAVYCSQQCRAKDREVHRYECKLNIYQHRVQDTTGSFRIFLALRTCLQVNIHDIIGEAKEGGLETKSVKGEASGLRSLFKMLTHKDGRDEESRIKYLVLASFVFRMLKECNFPLGGYEDIQVLEIIHRLVMIYDVNTHPVLALDHDGKSTSQVGLGKIGSAINVNIGSFFNHSCNPNTCRINQGRNTILISTRNIKKGEEITDIYSMHYSEIPRSQRGEWLQQGFFFTCCCKACVRNWPTYDDLPAEIRPDLLQELQQVETAIHHAVKNNDLLGGLSLHLQDVGYIESKFKEPHRLFVSVRNSLQFCLWRLYGSPMGSPITPITPRPNSVDSRK